MKATTTARIAPGSAVRRPGYVPISMTAGGPESAALAAELADGVITSVEVPEETPAHPRHPMVGAGTEPRRGMGGAWCVAGPARAGTLEAADPADLREGADEMDLEEARVRHSIVRDPQDCIARYLARVEFGPEVATVQTTSLDQESTIAELGAEVLPELRRATR